MTAQSQAVFTALANLALQALYMLRQIRPSVCPSVSPSGTLRYCAKTRKPRGMRSSPSGAQCL